MSEREEALAQIAALAARHGIEPLEIAAALEKARDAADLRKPGGGIAMRLFGYLGGIFIFSGLSAYISMFWEEMNSAMRVIITLGSGFALFIAGVTASRHGRRVAVPLLLMAALMQPGGLFVLAHEYFHTGDDPRTTALVIFGIMTLQQVLTLRALPQEILVCGTIGFGGLFFADAFDLMHVPARWIAVMLGLSLTCIACGLERTRYSYMAGFWYLIGSTSLLGGAFAVLQGTAIEALYIALACAVIFLSVIVHNTVLLVVGTCAMLGYICYFTHEHFMHSFGWPLSLMLLGLVFVAISLGALRLKKKYL